MVSLFLRWYRKHRLEFTRYQHRRLDDPLAIMQHTESVLSDFDFTDKYVDHFGLLVNSRLKDVLVLIRLLEEINTSLNNHSSIRYNRRGFSLQGVDSTCTQWLWTPMYRKSYTLAVLHTKLVRLLNAVNVKLLPLYQQQPRYVIGHLQDIASECSVLVELFIEIALYLETKNVKG